MATYKELHGQAVKDESSDPTATGEIFYNSSTNTFRSVVQTEAWRSQSPLSVGRSLAGTAGTSTAGLAFGGEPGPASPSETTATEEWNGSGWTAGGALPTATRSMGAFGTQTAAIAAGGLVPPPTHTTNTTHLYNGTSWSNTGNAVSYTAHSMKGSGTSTAGLVYGGSPLLTTSSEYDGEGWTAGGSMSNGRMQHGGSPNGTQTAALAATGVTTPSPGTATTAVEHYDGTSWTSGTAIPAAKWRAGSAGSQTANLIFSGYTAPYSSGPITTTTFKYDGTTWTNGGAVPTAGQQSRGFGTQGAAFMLGGNPPSPKDSVNEYNISTTVTTPAAFSSGNNQNLSSYNRSGWGTQTAAWVAGGGFPSDKNESEEYDGTTWTEGNNLNTARNSAAVGGPQTAAIFATGSRTTNVEYYNGTSWTAQTASPQVRSSAAGGGTQTSFVMAGGSTAGSPYYPISSTGEEWNGSSWTSSGALPAPQGSMNGSALGESESAVILAGGASSPAGSPGYVPHVVTNVSLDYGGTSWTANPSIITARVSPYFFGTTSLGILAGGDTNNSGATTTISEQWNGSVFVTGVSMSTGRYTGGRAGTATAGLVAGGYPGTTASANATEEYTGETTAANVKTITTS